MIDINIAVVKSWMSYLERGSFFITFLRKWNLFMKSLLIIKKIRSCQLKNT